LIRVVTTDVFENATTTASTTESGFAASNVNELPLKRLWRSTDDDDEWLKFDLGSAQAVDTFTIHDNNISSSATVRLFGHSTDLGSNPADWLASADFNTGNTLTFDNIVGALYLTTAETHRWWLLEIDDPTNPDTYVEVGRVFGGLSTSPDENFNENFSVTWMDNSRNFESEGGSKYSVEKVRPKVFEISFNDIDAANVDVVEAWWTSVYTVCPLVIALDKDDEPLNWTRIGTLQNDLEWLYGPNERATTTLIFKELK
jgi:hypothetical protein